MITQIGGSFLLPVSLHVFMDFLTSFFECPPARDPAEQTGLQLVCGLGQAGRQRQCACWDGSLKPKQCQVIVMDLVIVVLVQVDVGHSQSFLSLSGGTKTQLT